MRMLFSTLLVTSLCLGAISASADAKKQNSSPLSYQVGWIQDNCLAIKHSTISLPEKITILLPNETLPITGTIIDVATSGTRCVALLPNRAGVNKGNGYSFYVVNSDRHIAGGIGIIGNVDARALTTSHCSTSEGVRFFLARDGKHIWSGYYYLGYDVHPTCH